MLLAVTVGSQCIAYTVLTGIWSHQVWGRFPPNDKALVLALTEARQFRRGETHVHGGHVVIVGLAHFLHDLLLGQTAGLDRALHRDGPLRVVQGQVLQPGRGRSG